MGSSSVLVQGLVALAAGLCPLGASAIEHRIDPTHTFATFEIDHFGATTNRGRFVLKQGALDFNLAEETGKVDVTLDTTSVSTGSAVFDAKVRSDDVLDVERFPTARFVSDRFVFERGRLTEVRGQLTLKDQTQPVSFRTLKFNCYNNLMFGRTVCGGEFEAVIDRTAFGIDYLVRFGMPKEVRLLVQMEAIQP
ncbi:YceI family protein [Hydrogenophaga sp.]|uniref:YceI family protein n=1 Tax=Hydrogenophaga sp. TaxID=1904254 RepID=UPI0035B0DFA7